MNATENDIYSTPANSFSTEEAFEKLYITSRKTENRIYSDEEVLCLPSINRSHAHYKEWQVRKRSADRLIRYLKNKNRPLSILETGCGNGWLSAKLSEQRDSKITGVDINKTELRQAQRVFGNKSNLVFKEGTVTGEKFDVIIFAASIQYFPAFSKAIDDALSKLEQGGEIHIIDSHFYANNEINAARERSRNYYRSIGREELAGFYFHHSWDGLKGLNHQVLFEPSSFINRLFNRQDPFPWIRILHT